MKVYEKAEIIEKLKTLDGWEYTENQIERSYTLKNFMTVIHAVNKVADEAEKINHHPDIIIYSWNNVKFKLSTHSEGGVTQNDFNLADRIDQIMRGV